MAILQKNKVRLENDVTTRKNPCLSFGIYLTTAKVAQYRLVSENRRENDNTGKIVRHH